MLQSGTGEEVLVEQIVLCLLAPAKNLLSKLLQEKPKMGRVTTVILAHGELEDRELVRELNAWLESDEGCCESGQFFCLSAHMGDAMRAVGKAIEHPTYIAAFNYLAILPFVEHVRAMSWIRPDDVQIFARTPEETRYEMARQVVE